MYQNRGLDSLLWTTLCYFLSSFAHILWWKCVLCVSCNKCEVVKSHHLTGELSHHKASHLAAVVLFLSLTSCHFWPIPREKLPRNNGLDQASITQLPSSKIPWPNSVPTKSHFSPTKLGRRLRCFGGMLLSGVSHPIWWCLILSAVLMKCIPKMCRPAFVKPLQQYYIDTSSHGNKLNDVINPSTTCINNLRAITNLYLLYCT